jgi:hypothetical protein
LRRRSERAFLTARQSDQLVAFLRDWLPDEAKHVYRELIKENPKGWWRDAHFAGDIILKHALRGNGIDERALGIKDLTPVWPALLARAVDIEDA